MSLGLLALAGSALCACAPFTETFQIKTLDTYGNGVPALIIMNGRYEEAQRNNTVTDPQGNGYLTLPLGMPSATISVKGLKIEGNTRYGEWPNDPSPYLSPPTRELRRSDPPVQLFVLRDNRAWQRPDGR
jgi:hypothetical protein